jgi:hypothetical protein
VSVGYEYADWVVREVERAIRDAIPLPRISLKKASLEDDFGGVDFRYTVNQSCDVQVRCRFNRPAYAADTDVTFRHTEPAMIEARTYAPLMMFLWLRDQRAVAGRLVDVYRMAANIAPSLAQRQWIQNRRGTRTYFTTVDMAELHASKALLRIGDDDHWVAARLNGNTDTLRILESG